MEGSQREDQQLIQSRQKELFSRVDPPGPQKVNGCTQIAPFSNAFSELDISPRFLRWKKNIITKEEAINIDYEQQQRFRVNGIEHICKIKATTIIRKEKNKGTGEIELKEYVAWPGEREFLIEKVLFMLAANEGLIAKRDKKAIRYGLEFSLYSIYNALKELGRTRNYDEILESLIILRDSRTLISKVESGRQIEITHNIITDALFDVSGSGRSREPMQIIFSDYVANAVHDVNYIQYPFASIHANSYELSRHIHMYMILNHRNMCDRRTIPLYAAEILESFGKKRLSLPQMRRDMRSALEVLVKQGILCGPVPKAAKARHRDELDSVYHVLPTVDLVEQVIQSNSKHKGIRMLNEKILDNPTRQIQGHRAEAIYTTT